MSSGREFPGNRQGMANTQDHAFGTGQPFSLGAEEELFLVDPVNGRMVNSSAAVTERLASAMGGIERELHAGMIEFVSDVCQKAPDVIGQLAHRRAACLGTGVGLMGSGTHPTATDDEAQISDKERYERVSRLLGAAVATPVAGLHVHVGMPDAETAIKVFNADAHSPSATAGVSRRTHRFGGAWDTGLASARGCDDQQLAALRHPPRAGRLRGLLRDGRPAHPSRWRG